MLKNKGSPSNLRIFTKDLSSTLLPLRLPLKNWEYGLSYNSYKLPFVFDNLRFMSYRVEAKSLGFSFDREQRKYLISYDLGNKKHLKISSTQFMSFRRYFSFGRMIYNRNNMIGFFKTLRQGGSLYSHRLSTGFSRDHLLQNYSWYLDSFPLVFRKRFSFHRKLQTQNFDIDLTVSTASSSLGTLFIPLLPTRYNSFFASSFTDNKPLRFTARYFRYFHKYNLRKDFWSNKLYFFWNGLDNSFSGDTSYALFSSGWFCYDIGLFLKFRLVMKFISNLSFLASIFYGTNSGRLLLCFFWFVLLNGGAPGLLFVFLKHAAHVNNNVYALGGIGQPNKLSFTNTFLQRKYIILRLANSLNVIGRYGFYRPWRNRFAFSLRNYTFMSIYPQIQFQKKFNVSSRKTFSKNVYKRDWHIYDSFHIAHRRARKIFGKTMLLFFSKQSSMDSLFTKLPFVLKRFFKFSRRFFPASFRSYTDFLSRSGDPKTIFMSQQRLVDSSSVSLKLLRANIFNLTAELARRINKQKGGYALSFLQKMTSKDIAQLLKSLRDFNYTSTRLVDKIKSFSSRWWRNYPLARRTNFAHLKSNNFSVIRRVYRKSLLQMLILVKLMHWRFSGKQVKKELRFFVARWNLTKLWRFMPKKWVPTKVFKSRLLAGKFLRSQPFILNTFFNSLRFTISNFARLSNQFKKYVASLENMPVLSSRFSSWFNLWNGVIRRRFFRRALRIEQRYPWDFGHLPFLGPKHSYTGITSQRLFFLLNGTKKIAIEGKISFNLEHWRQMQGLPVKALVLLNSFARDQLTFKKLMEARKRAQANKVKLMNRNKHLYKGFSSKKPMEGRDFKRPYVKRLSTRSYNVYKK